MKSFKLVNPLIIGQFNTEYTADNGIQAVYDFWTDLGSHITNNLPHTYVTLKDDNNNLSHYKISEKINDGSKTADFTISEFNLNLSDKQKNKFLKKVSTFESKTTKTLEKQTGGVVKRKQSRSRKDDSSSSSSDSSSGDDYYNFSKYKKLSQPIAMWYYTPNLYGVRSVFLPTFNVPIVPYVKLWVPRFF